jgi:hypothetical protein
MMTYHLTLKSTNFKTGDLPVSTSPRGTCWKGCPFLKNGCYADSGPLALHWDKVSSGERGTSWLDFCANIAALKLGQVWRHDQAGDLPPQKSNGDNLSARKVRQLVTANKGKRGFTYCHYPDSAHNVRVIAHANANGLTVNLSANNLTHADQMARHGLPIAVVIPVDVKYKKTHTSAGMPVVVCPATYRDDISCGGSKATKNRKATKACGNGNPLCARAERSYAIGFPAHGPSKRKANTVACA